MVNLALAGLLTVAAVGIMRHGCRQRRGRYTAYDAIIEDAARRQSLSPSLVRAVIRQESDFHYWRIGRAGEIGLMQVTGPAVADWERATGNRCRFRGKLFDARLNIEVGTWYLARALRRWSRYRDAEVLALAEYNAGYSRARKWAPADPREPALPAVAFPSTRTYISNVLAYREAFDKGKVPR
ncbi:MAG: Soluble lytic murein transglycosylase precursor [Lentisphaerae bacterium ADurb.BinA184]|nr:MAG: Soluble lytic murein transglycosylase precursor [Lentisphaerae bacterium ADurb.BinA184]